jgi:hypothetical protein
MATDQLSLFPAEPRLSKSKYVSGLQCHKRLYLEIHNPELATEPDERMQAVLDSGTEVGELARTRFPGGVLVGHGHAHLAEALTMTKQLIHDPTVSAIFEATLQYDNVLVRVDILERLPHDVWHLIEVKASTKVKPVHLDDLAVQAYVLGGAGLTLAGMRLMHLNRSYVHPGGPLDIGQLFTLADVTAAVVQQMAEVPVRLHQMKAMLIRPDTPNIQPGAQCHEPYECRFWAHCTEQKPARWLFYLPGSKRNFLKLVERGIDTIDEIPAGIPLSAAQQRMKDNVEWIGPQLQQALKSVQYPIHHLDFETFMPALPRYPQTRPYHTLPFQWSNHIEMDDGSVCHEAFLSSERKDPREEFALRLLESVGSTGTICVYSDYERGVLQNLAEVLPSLRREIQAVMSRLWDLFSIVQRHYYHPGFSGSYSIKSVLPALAPHLDYADLEIRDGELASLMYRRMMFEDVGMPDEIRIRTALLEYCKRDTLGMLEIRRALWQKLLVHTGHDL